MPNLSIDKNIFPIEPLLDTWGVKKDAATWYIDLPFNFNLSSSIQEHNAWYANTIMATLDTFAELARIYKISFGPIPGSNSKVKGILLEWKSEESYEEYLKKVLQAIREYPVDIFLLRLDVDLYVFVRTEQSPNEPIRAWVRNNYMGMFEISLQLEDKQPYIYFSMENALFFPFYDVTQTDNSKLFSLNQPLLFNALQRWEERLGNICDFEGRGTIYKYGFLPEEE